MSQTYTDENQSPQQAQPEATQQQQPAAATEEQTQQKKAKRSGSGTSQGKKITMTANAIVTKRYECPTVTTESGTVFYTINAPSMAFDRIFRRTAKEVNRNAESYTVPLGKSCVEAVVSLYGLSNGDIYNDPRWLKAISQYNYMRTEASAEDVVKFLRGAAYLKYWSVSGKHVDRSDEYGFIEAVHSTNEREIVNYFAAMVR